MKEIIRLMNEVEYLAAGRRIQDDDLRACLLSIAVAVKRIASKLGAEEGDRK